MKNDRSQGAGPPADTLGNPSNAFRPMSLQQRQRSFYCVRCAEVAACSTSRAVSAGCDM